MTNTGRISKEMYYLGIAKAVSQRSSCLNKHWGAVIVKDDVIVSTGFNGAPRGCKDCYEKGFCRLSNYRRDNKLGRGEGYEQCLSVHAEMNAIIQASKEELEDSTLYLYGVEQVDMDGTWWYVKSPRPCVNCRRAIMNAKISNVIVQTTDTNYSSFNVKSWSLVEDEIVGGY